ncbi:MAG: exosortase/archaeosortase family protein [Chthoniobacterales bacterium]
MHDLTAKRRGVAQFGSGPRSLPYDFFFAAALAIWAIWACAEHWRGNPNYSYGWVVPAFALTFGIRRVWKLGPVPADGDFVRVRLSAVWPRTAAAFALGALVYFLEFSRQDVWHPQIVLWSICLLAICAVFFVLITRGGKNMAGAQIFPVLFFLTAVPWPPRFEQPITSGLMAAVATATVELLHWFGILAEQSGAAIALRGGLVGITEACSGIRSLQAGLMFGVAIGEWFLLSIPRRALLVPIAAGLALLTNLARTVALSLQAEWHGITSVERVHDLIGNVVISALIAGIWLAGRLLRPIGQISPSPGWADVKMRWYSVAQNLRRPLGTSTRLTFVLCLVGFVTARVLYARIEARERAQQAPYFSALANLDPLNRAVPIPKEIWTELHPTTGEYIQRRDLALPRGAADCYHFFWKPSPWNRFVLVHRPDVCMPGIGWQLTAGPERLEVEMGGRALSCYAFRFQRGNFHALELWGVWRNGEAVPLNYHPAQVLGAAVPPPGLKLEGKRKSATEIVACSLIAEGEAPSTATAVGALQSVFAYHSR